MDLTPRQLKIIQLIKEREPITGEEIAEIIGVTRSALRTDFSVLTNKGYIKSKTRIGYIYQEKKEKVYIKDIMGEAIYVKGTLSVYETILKIFEKDIGTLFIVEEDSLVGVVSRKDLLKIAIGKNDIDKVPVNVIMARMPNIIYCEENERIIEGADKLIKHQINSIPVVKKIEIDGEIKYKLVGRLTKTNITRLFLENYDK